MASIDWIEVPITEFATLAPSVTTQFPRVLNLNGSPVVTIQVLIPIERGIAYGWMQRERRFCTKIWHWLLLYRQHHPQVWAQLLSQTHHRQLLRGTLQQHKLRNQTLLLQARMPVLNLRMEAQSSRQALSLVSRSGVCWRVRFLRESSYGFVGVGKRCPILSTLRETHMPWRLKRKGSPRTQQL
jgi:hypothetical protein